jgi:hypothetical protein
MCIYNFRHFLGSQNNQSPWRVFPPFYLAKKIAHLVHSRRRRISADGIGGKICNGWREKRGNRKEKGGKRKENGVKVVKKLNVIKRKVKREHEK